MNQTTIELAVQALEAEKAKVDAAIAELRASINGRGGAKPAVRRAPSAAVITVTGATAARVGTRKPARRMSAAARKALSDSAKRRWAKAKAAGKSSL
ncbi:MAG TPA: hypothetical protein VFY29_14515 [Terriglobia bacterium]|nr:hypothetical protein [Terriglobia bacterium]